MRIDQRDDFLADLAMLINKHSIEKYSNTPDYILAAFLCKCLESYNDAVHKCFAWHER